MRTVIVNSTLLFIVVFGLAVAPVLACPGRDFHPDRDFHPVLDFQAIGSGIVTYYGLPDHSSADCQTSESGCAIETEGTVKGNQIGKGTFTNAGIVLWKAGFPNGSGGHCAPGSGTETITAADGSTLIVKWAGIFCEVGSAGPPYTFNGSYFITGGTKRFEGASGLGVVIASGDTNGNFLEFAHGTIGK